MVEDMKKLQGCWKQLVYEKDGLKNPLDEVGWDPRTTFTDDTFIVTLSDGSIVIKGTYKLDPTREPKAVDWSDQFGADAGKTFPAIYSLEGDRLVFCVADEGQARPTEFICKPGLVLRILQRLT